MNNSRESANEHPQWYSLRRAAASAASWLRRLWSRLTLGERIRLQRPWLLLPGPIILLTATLLPARWVFFMAYAYLLLALIAYFWTRLLGAGVRLGRQWSGEWLQAGDLVQEQWELVNQSWLPLLWLEVEDASTLPGYNSRWATGAAPFEQRQWRTGVVCRQRGIYSLGPLQARLGDPFGIFEYVWQEPEVRQLVVYPPLLALPPLTFPHGQRGGMLHAQLQQQLQTPSVSGLRAYLPGDIPSRIHWPTVARTGELMVKEFDQERAGALWIVLDLQGAAYASLQPATPVDVAVDPGAAYRQSSLVAEPAATLDLSAPLELAIALSCSLAAQALAEGRAVGLLADDGRQRLVMPGQGPRQLWRILGALTDAQAQGVHPLGVALQQGQAAVGATLAGAALAIVTPDLSGNWLPALTQARRRGGAGVLALLVSTEQQFARPLEQRLAALGIAAQTFVTAVELPLLNPPSRRPARRVSPLGKVI